MTGNSYMAASSSFAAYRQLIILATITNAANVTANLTINGAPGTVVFAAQNAFNGNITVDGSGSAVPGTNVVVQLGINNALPTTVGLSLIGATNPAVLDLDGNNQILSNLTFTAGTGTYVDAYVTNSLHGTVSTLSIGYNNPSYTNTVSGGPITDNPLTGGTVALTKVGTSTLVLSTANTYSGNTRVNGGTLQMGASSVMPYGVGKGDLYVNSPGIFDLSGHAAQSVNGLFGTGTIDNSGGSSGTNDILTLLPTNGVTAVFSGTIQNTLGPAYVAITLNGTNGVESLQAATHSPVRWWCTPVNCGSTTVGRWETPI